MNKFTIWANNEIVAVANNLVTTAGKAMLRACLRDSEVEHALQYIAVGSGAEPPAVTNPPMVTDTELQTERVRLPISRLSEVGDSILAYAFFRATTLSFIVQEVGIFGGGATNTEQGTLFNRALLEYNGTPAQHDVTIQVEVEID